jgi:hypothetical protein
MIRHIVAIGPPPPPPLHGISLATSGSSMKPICSSRPAANSPRRPSPGYRKSLRMIRDRSEDVECGMSMKSGTQRRENGRSP